MASAEQSGEPLRDYGSPATWGDVEQVRQSLGAQIDTQIADVKTQMAEMQTQIAQQMAQLETRMEARLAGMETQLETRLAGMDTRLETRLAGMDTRLETRMAAMDTERARMETRLTRLFLGAVAGGVTVIGILIGIVQAVD